jgi:hypothetical protein
MWEVSAFSSHLCADVSRHRQEYAYHRSPIKICFRQSQTARKREESRYLNESNDRCVSECRFRRDFSEFGSKPRTTRSLLFFHLIAHLQYSRCCLGRKRLCKGSPTSQMLLRSASSPRITLVIGGNLPRSQKRPRWAISNHRHDRVMMRLWNDILDSQSSELIHIFAPYVGPSTSRPCV